MMCPFFAERPPIAVGIKGPMTFWVWYESVERRFWTHQIDSLAIKLVWSLARKAPFWAFSVERPWSEIRRPSLKVHEHRAIGIKPD
jgi:hypothetical protein